MKNVEVDQSKLLGFRLLDEKAGDSAEVKLGAKIGVAKGDPIVPLAPTAVG